MNKLKMDFQHLTGVKIMTREQMKIVKGGIAFPQPELIFCNDGSGQNLGYVCVTISGMARSECLQLFPDTATVTDSHQPC